MSGSDVTRPEVKKTTYKTIITLAGLENDERPSLESALQIILKKMKK